MIFGLEQTLLLKTIAKTESIKKDVLLKFIYSK